jgi:hypothetical protein
MITIKNQGKKSLSSILVTIKVKVVDFRKNEKIQKILSATDQI